MSPQDRDALLAEITVIRANLFSGTHNLPKVDESLTRVEKLARQEEPHEKDALKAHKELDEKLAKEAADGHKAIEAKRVQAAKNEPVKPTPNSFPATSSGSAPSQFDPVTHRPLAPTPSPAPTHFDPVTHQPVS